MFQKQIYKTIKSASEVTRQCNNEATATTDQRPVTVGLDHCDQDKKQNENDINGQTSSHGDHEHATNSGYFVSKCASISEMGEISKMTVSTSTTSTSSKLSLKRKKAEARFGHSKRPKLPPTSSVQRNETSDRPLELDMPECSSSESNRTTDMTDCRTNIAGQEKSDYQHDQSGKDMRSSVEISVSRTCQETPIPSVLIKNDTIPNFTGNGEDDTKDVPPCDPDISTPSSSSENKLAGEAGEQRKELDDLADGTNDVEEYRVPYYLENFLLILDTVLADEYYLGLFNNADLESVASFRGLSGESSGCCLS